MKKALTLPLASFANILAQAPVVSAAFGRGLGFTLMMTALFGAFSLGGYGNSQPFPGRHAANCLLGTFC